MDRIILYDEQTEEFLADPKNAEFKTIVSGHRITLVSDGHSLHGAQKKSYDAMVKEGKLEHITWRSFLLRTRKMHASFLEEADRQKKLFAKQSK
jgi:hypothetical protein